VYIDLQFSGFVFKEGYKLFSTAKNYKCNGFVCEKTEKQGRIKNAKINFLTILFIVFI